MAVNTYATLTEEQQKTNNRALIERLLPKLLFVKYGQKTAVPAGKGRTVRWRKFEPLAMPTAPLTEGVTPTGNTLSVVGVEASLTQVGDYVEISDLLQHNSLDAVLAETSELLGEQAGQYIDGLVRNIVCAGTNVLYPNGKTATTLAASDKLDAASVARAVRALRAANAEPLQGGYYVGVLDPYTEYDIMTDPLWQDISKYNGGTAIMEGEVGRIHGVRFVVTTQTAKKTLNSVEAHSVLILGKDAYGVVDFAGSASRPQVYYQPLGSGGTDDPLHQRATQGWKADLTAIRLNELAMVNIWCAATA